VSDATTLAIERYLQTLEEMAAVANDQGFVSSTRRWDLLVDRLRADETVVGESPEGRTAVESLLTDPRPTVRLRAATTALTWDEARARDVLVEIREKPNLYGLSSINAKRVLLEHDAGRLDPPAPS